MAKVLGYGGIANTNGARDFSGKEESESPDTPPLRMLMGVGRVFVPFWLVWGWM